MRLLWSLFFSFFKIGAFTFGGGLAMLPIIRRVVVEEKAWLTDEEIVDCFAICQSLPGVLAINSAIYIGNKKRGLAGATSAGIGVILPSFSIIMVVMLFLGKIEDNIYVLGAFEGIKAASVGLILVAALNMGKKVLRSKLSWCIAFLAFLLVIVLDVTAVWVVLLGGILGYLSYLVKKRKEAKE